MSLVVTCQPLGTGPSVAPCSDVAGVPHGPVLVEMVTTGTISFSNADQLFAYGLSAVVTVWLVGLVVGLILSLLK